MTFTHLRVHTEYSLLNGSSKIKELPTRAKELGMDSLTITDHGVMCGVIGFYRAAGKVGVKPIVGYEVYVAPNSWFDREAVSDEDRYYHLILLVGSNQGYQDLMKIASKELVDGFYYEPRVDYEMLRERHEGIICLFTCLTGEVQRYLARGLYQEGEGAALRYEEIFGKGNFFLRLQDHGIPEQKTVSQALPRLSQELQIDLTATNDTRYTFAENAVPHDILLYIRTSKKVTDESRMRYEGGQFYCKSEEEMRVLFPYALEALENTQKIADQCSVEIEFGVTELSRFDVSEGYDAWEYLNKLCDDDMAKHYPDDDGTSRERLKYELDVIHTMSYADCFLIVQDFIHFAESHDIMVGPGRSSATESIVSYCLGITDVDPIHYNLLLECFLNPERVSTPDIDIDFCFEERQGIIDYVVERYGKDQVAQIVIFGTLTVKGVVWDVSQALDIPYARCDMIAKMIPSGLGMTLGKALKANPDLRSAYNEDERVKYLIDMSMRLEGLPRHTSMRTARVVISQASVDNYVPLSKAAGGAVTTRSTMTTLERLGLLKMDFLGLRTLTVIRNAVWQMKRTQGIDLGVDAISYNNKQVLDSPGTGKDGSVFQLENPGMESFMKELKPENLEDIIAGISLYRPGPMDFVPRHLRGRNEKGSIIYECPQLEPISGPTYGCIVYQEQVMQIVQDLAGYTLGRSDTVRRAMSKKKSSVMERERQNFVYESEGEGVKSCINDGIDEKTANLIFDEMIDFIKCTLNKSHTACYVVVSYQTAYLKYYYPKEFMAAVMTSVMDNISEASKYILICRQMDVEMLSPDINEGKSGFSMSGDSIRYDLSTIEGVGKSVVKVIITEREANGPFVTLEDFMGRLSNKEVNRQTLENFIKAGALDTLPGDRRQKLLTTPDILDQKNKEKKTGIEGQMNLFDFASEESKESFRISMPNVEKFFKEDLPAFEKEILGTYISDHPMEAYEQSWQANITAITTDFIVDEETEDAKVRDGTQVIIGGMITGKIVGTTRTGRMMAFVTVEDLVGSAEVLVFPRDYDKYREILIPGTKVFIQGRASIGDDPVGKVICERVIPFEKLPRRAWIQFADKGAYTAQEAGVMDCLKMSEGSDNVIIYLAKEKAKKVLPANWSVSDGPGLVAALSEVVGEKNVKIVEETIEKIGKMN